MGRIRCTTLWGLSYWVVVTSAQAQQAEVVTTPEESAVGTPVNVGAFPDDESTAPVNSSVDTDGADLRVPDPPSSSQPVTRSEHAACVLGEHAGISEPEARTAASIVCGELAMHGPEAGRTYRVLLGRLGKVLVLSLSEELEDGTVTDHRQVNLEGIEEVPIAAPRLVTALVEDKALQETETVENLVGQDTRPIKKREGESFFAIGVVGLIADTEGPNTSVGADMAFGYEAPTVGIGYDLRFAAISEGVGVGMFATGPFVRYFFVKKDISPYMGGGLGPMLLQVESDGLRADRWGLAFWAEAGVELMRTHKSQLAAGGRLDVPTFTVSDDTNSGFVLPFEVVATFNFE